MHLLAMPAVGAAVAVHQWESPAMAAAATESEAVKAARAKIVDVMEKSAAARGDGSSMGPTLVRLA